MKTQMQFAVQVFSSSEFQLILKKRRNESLSVFSHSPYWTSNVSLTQVEVRFHIKASVRPEWPVTSHGPQQRLCWSREELLSLLVSCDRQSGRQLSLLWDRVIFCRALRRPRLWGRSVSRLLDTSCRQRTDRSQIRDLPRNKNLIPSPLPHLLPALSGSPAVLVLLEGSPAGSAAAWHSAGSLACTPPLAVTTADCD